MKQLTTQSKNKAVVEADKTAWGTRWGLLKAKFWLSLYCDAVISRFPLPDLNTGLPLLIVANHPGWLDIELSLFIVEAMLGHNYYMMSNTLLMDEKPSMRKFGVFSVDDSDVFAVGRTLKYAATLLQNQADRCLVMFPQGEFTRSTVRPIHAHFGAAQIARLIKHVTILPVAIHYDIFFDRLPHAYIRFGDPFSFRGNVPPTRVLTETIRQSIEDELDALQADVYDCNLDDYDFVMKHFFKRLSRE